MKNFKSIPENELETILKDSKDDGTWASRSVLLCDKICKHINKYIKDNDIPFRVARKMSGLNDRIIISNNNDDLISGDKYISFIIGWMYGDAELAVVKLKGENPDPEFETVSKEYIEIKNENISRDPDGIHEGLLDNTVKYYHSPFDERFEDIIKDMETILSKMTQ